MELLDAVGADNLTYQKLDDCLLRARSVKRGVDITFGTNVVTAEDLALGDPSHVGFIVWVPIEHARRVQAQIDAAKAKEQSDGRNHVRRMVKGR